MEKLVNYENLEVFHKNIINDDAVSKKSTWSSFMINSELANKVDNQVALLLNNRISHIAQYVIWTDEIWYTSSDDNIVTPYTFQLPTIVSNTVYNSIGTIKFASDVTMIGIDSFKDCNTLTSITIPSSVTIINNKAFENCTGLTSITIPSSVTSIGSDAFRNTGLTYVEFPNSVTTLGDWSFQNCRNLKSVKIPSSVTNFGSSMFTDCPNLRTVVIDSNSMVSENYSADGGFINQFGRQVTNYIIGNNVTSIGNYAFARSGGLQSINIPSSVTSIGSGAFNYCNNLHTVTLDSNSIVSHNYTNGQFFATGVCALFPQRQVIDYILGNNVTSIGNYAFANNPLLTSITIPSSVTSIGDYAFSGSNITSITIPSSVTSIGNYAFDSVTEVTLESTTPISLEDQGDIIYAFGKVGGGSPASGSGSGSTPYSTPYSGSTPWSSGSGSTPWSSGSGSGSGGGRTIRIYVPAAAFNDYYNSQDAGWQYYRDCLVNPND